MNNNNKNMGCAVWLVIGLVLAIFGGCSGIDDFLGMVIFGPLIMVGLLIAICCGRL